MTGKKRFGSFVTAPQTAVNEEKSKAPASQKSQKATSEPTPSPSSLTTEIPAAPVREERRAFSTRVRPSQKAMLDGYVMDLKRAGWPVSQEAVLEELLHALETDEAFKAGITERLMRLKQ